MTPNETYAEWWTEQVARAYYSWVDANHALAEIAENEPEIVRIFTKVGFLPYLLQNLQTAQNIIHCFREFKRQATVDCRPAIKETQATILIANLQETLRSIWTWIKIMRLDETERWTRHGQDFRAELVRSGLMAYSASDWPVPFPKMYGILPQATRLSAKRRSSEVPKKRM